MSKTVMPKTQETPIRSVGVVLVCCYCEKYIKMRRSEGIYWWVNNNSEDEILTGIWCNKNPEEGLHIPMMRHVERSLEVLMSR